MRDIVFVGLAIGFFALTAWLAAFADRIMPVPAARQPTANREEPR